MNPQNVSMEQVRQIVDDANKDTPCCEDNQEFGPNHHTEWCHKRKPTARDQIKAHLAKELGLKFPATKYDPLELLIESALGANTLQEVTQQLENYTDMLIDVQEAIEQWRESAGKSMEDEL